MIPFKTPQSLTFLLRAVTGIEVPTGNHMDKNKRYE